MVMGPCWKHVSTGNGIVFDSLFFRFEFDTVFLMRYNGNMKQCSKCEALKPEEEFAWRKKNVSRTSVCKVCQRLIAQQHYENNKTYYKDKSKRNRSSYRERGKAFLIDHLRSHPCVDCGNDDIEVLQFDHVEELKNWRAPRVTSLVNESIARIQKEIDKCEVRCANCHVKKTRRAAGTLRMPR